MHGRLIRLSAAALIVGVAATACAPVRSHSGYRPDYNNVLIADPEVGVDTRETVLQRFGTPSTTAVFDQTAWYYLSTVQERVAFYTPRISARSVMVVRFDAENRVAGVDKYGLERGQVVAYNEDATPTRGRELGLLEQIFGNIGNSSPIGTIGDEEQQGGRRRR
jgi:outer membrane protein assembly factor BamE (lipoprotein component of BamABCDE complex)